MTGRLRVGVLYGGTSTEHEVSRSSAASVVRHLDRDRYDVGAIGIARGGSWHRLPAAVIDAARAPARSGRAIDDQLPLTGGRVDLTAVSDFDVVFPVLHGPGGEDGTVPGLLELSRIPYVGAGVLASAVGLDKVATKRALSAAGIPVAAFVAIDEDDWAAGGDPVRLVAGLAPPWFVKPANSGSSIGVSRVTDPLELDRAIRSAFAHDGVVVIEEGVPAAHELECGVLGGYRPASSVVGEVIVTGGWFDYEQKYHAATNPMVVPAHLDEDVATRVRDLAVRAFHAIGGWGLARVDFLYDERTDRLVVNELNTVPGFTAHSMFPMLWAATGMTYPQLLDALVALALDRSARRTRRDRRRSALGRDGRPA